MVNDFQNKEEGGVRLNLDLLALAGGGSWLRAFYHGS